MARASQGIGVFVWVVLVGISGYVLTATTATVRPSGPPSRPVASAHSRSVADAPMAMPLIAPLFVANQEFTSVLVLVNASGITTSADVVVRGMSGAHLAEQHVAFAPYSQQKVDIGALLASRGLVEDKGSIVVMPSSDLKGPAILAAVSVTYLGSSEGNFVDEELAMPMPTDSQVLRGVADRGEGPPLVAVTSLADTLQRVRVECFGSGKAALAGTISLSPGASAFVQACGDSGVDEAGVFGGDVEHRAEPRGSTGIVLTSDGMPGSFAAYGLSTHRDKDSKYFSSITFSDPRMTVSNTTVFAGVPAGSVSALPGRTYVPEISVANFSTKDARVTVQYALTSGGEGSSQNVWQGTLAAGRAREIRLGELQGDPSLQDSFVVSSDGSPGDVIAKLESVTDSGRQRTEVLGKDSNVFENGGAHPWSLEAGGESVLLLFNHSGDNQKVQVMLSSEHGGPRWEKSYKLKPLETRQLDIRELIQNRVLDDSGMPIPAGSVSGTAGWLTTKRGAVKGRILQINAVSGMARNFSCGEYTTINYAYWSDSGTDGDSSTVNILIGTTADSVGDATASLDLVYAGSCSGTFATDSANFGNYDYTSSGPSTAAIVASGDNPAEVNADSGGYATISGTVTDPSTGCEASAQGSVFVQIPTSLSIVSGTDNTTKGSCTTGGQTGCGATRTFTYQVLDQKGNSIKISGLNVWDAFGTPSPNPLGLTSFVTTCSPPNTGPCGKTTNGSGQFQEVGLSVCSTVCYNPTTKMCITGGPSVVTQTVHVANWRINQTVSYYCDHVLVNGS